MDKPFGSWESPITSKAITAGSVRLGSLHHNNANHQLYWLEGRPQEAGRNVLCRYVDPTNYNDNHQQQHKSERNGVDISPPESNVRTRVHEYGGGAIIFGKDESEIFYSEFASQRLCRLTTTTATTGGGSSSIPVSVEGDRFRYADGVVSRDGSTVYCVREDHQFPEPKNVVNEIISMNVADGDGATTVDGSSSSAAAMEVLATGNDFYAAPRVSPDGNSLAYITWNHPNMPWDATELRVRRNIMDDATGGKDSDSASHELIAGADGDTSIIQPLWHPQTGELYYISDQSGYYNIYRAGYEHSILPMKYDFGGSSPGWGLGQQGFCFTNDGRLVAQYSKDGNSVLVVANVTSRDENGPGPATEVEEFGVEDGLPMMFGGVVAGADNDLYFMGGSPSTPSSIYKWNLETKGDASILACSSNISFSEDLISVPEQIEFPTTLGTAFGYYYAPKNGGFTCTTEKAPPLLVKAHGGPTSCTGTSFNAAIQFWTSRGFAVLDVDYGGSTGYGRDYRHHLRKSWGVVDIDDV